MRPSGSRAMKRPYRRRGRRDALAFIALPPSGMASRSKRRGGIRVGTMPTEYHHRKADLGGLLGRLYCRSLGGMRMTPTPFSTTILVPNGFEYSSTSSRIIFATTGEGRFGMPICELGRGVWPKSSG